MRAFEASLQALLAPLANYARAQGIGEKRFASMLAAAVHGPRAAGPAPALPYDLAVRLVSRWATDKMYSSRGKPRPLPLSGSRSFTGLARAARAGSPAVALAALKGVGVVREDRQGNLVLRERAYVPRTGTEERFEIVGRAGAEFLRVLAHNLSCPPEDAFLQRAASYDSIGASSLMILRRALRREGMRALERANALLSARDRDRNPRAPGGRRSRVSFGVYVLTEPVGAAARNKRNKR